VSFACSPPGSSRGNCSAASRSNRGSPGNRERPGSQESVPVEAEPQRGQTRQIKRTNRLLSRLCHAGWQAGGLHLGLLAVAAVEEAEAVDEEKEEEGGRRGPHYNAEVHNVQVAQEGA